MAGNERTRDPLRALSYRLPWRDSNARPPHLAMRRSYRCTRTLHHRQTVLAGNERNREPSFAGGPCGLARTRSRRTRSLHHRQTGNRSGEQAKPERCLAAAPRSTRLSYRPHDGPGGIRTRDHVDLNEVPDFFTTGSELALSGNCRERIQPHQRRALLLEPATRRPSQGRLHGTRRKPAGFEPAFPGCEVSVLFTTD